MKSAILLEEDDILFSRSRYFAFLGATAADRAFRRAATIQRWISPARRYRIFGWSGQQRYSYVDAMKRFLVQKPQLLAFGVPDTRVSRGACQDQITICLAKCY